MKNKIEIPLSKKKIALLLFAAVVFVLIGVAFVAQPGTFRSSVLRSPEAIRIVGVASIAVFGVCGAFLAHKLFDRKTGLTIDENGITDHSSGVSAGLIEWDDITGLQRVQIASTKILVVMTDKPEKYIERAKNRFSRQMMKANWKSYGSPLSIAAVSLKIKFDDLEKLIAAELERRQKEFSKP